MVDNPITQTLIIKLFDPYDEGPWNSNAKGGIVNQPNSQTIMAPYNTKFPINTVATGATA